MLESARRRDNQKEMGRQSDGPSVFYSLLSIANQLAIGEFDISHQITNLQLDFSRS